MIMKDEIKDCHYLYKCYYCGDVIPLNDLLNVDKRLDQMDGEIHEFVLDSLPESTRAKESPFLHHCKYGYEVLNICNRCIEQAIKNI